MKTIKATRKELITVFTQWNKDFYESGYVPTLHDYKASAKLAIEQADDLISYLTKLQEEEK